MSKYIKGSFVVVPNKETLRGQTPLVQTVYFWICNYSNDKGECFPSIETLSRDSGVAKRTIDKAIRELELIGILQKINRSIGKEKVTNLYQVMILDDDICPTPSANSAVPSANSALPPSANSAHRTQSIYLTQSTEVCEQSSRPPKKKTKKERYSDTTTMSRDEFVEKMKSSPQKHIQIIGEWAECEAPAFTKKGEWHAYTDRNLRPAMDLIAFDISKIETAYLKMLKDVKSKDNPKGYITRYTLETLAKYII